MKESDSSGLIEIPPLAVGGLLPPSPQPSPSKEIPHILVKVTPAC